MPVQLRSLIGAAAVLTVLWAGCSADGPTPDPSGSGGSGAGQQGGEAGATNSSGGGAGGSELPAEFAISGVVVDQDGAPVADALVLQGGLSAEPALLTGSDGSFSLTMAFSGEGTPAVVATKQGYRTSGLEFFKPPAAPITLKMHIVPEEDNETYVYGEPGNADAPTTAYCGHCHNTLADQFQSSGHARATNNPQLQDLYAGVASGLTDASSCLSRGGQWKAGLVPGSSADSAVKCYLGEGVLATLNAQCGGSAQPACDEVGAPTANLPTDFGACANCHAPGIDGKAGGRNLHEAVGVAFDNGVHCDPCHKTADIDLSKPPGVGSRLVTRRPSDHVDDAPGSKLRQVMFGPLVDVANAFMGGSLQPKFREAQFCAGCHEQNQPALIGGQTLDPTRWPDGLPVHSTYSEWQAGPYSSAGMPCQRCHMPTEYGLDSTADLATASTASITFGFTRPHEQIRQHIFRSPLQGSPRLIDTALTSKIELSASTDTLNATVTLGNGGCGHAVPTGEPMRALLLSIEADCDGIGLQASGGMTIPDFGGARAVGAVGNGVFLNATALSWPSAAASAAIGNRVRIVRPSGSYDDYNGIGFFANPALSPQEKGIAIHQPVGEAQVLSINGSTLTLDQTLVAQSGDIIYLGDALSPAQSGAPVGAVAGAAGYAFARVLLDDAGNRFVPHFRAVDIASDNRIAPASFQRTQHAFSLPAQCSEATVRMWVIYRPQPYALANQRGWDAKDYVIASAVAKLNP